MEKKIKRDLEDGIDTYTAERNDLNYFFEKYMETKHNLRPSTRENYIYMYTKYVSEDLGKRKLTAIKYSDIKRFYMHLIYDIGLKPNSMEIIHTILHGQSCPGHDPTYNAEGEKESRCGVAAPQRPRLSIYVTSIF